jgi:hypothetical protein
MSKSLILMLFMFVISQASQAGIFKSYQNKKNCTQYQVVNKVRTDSGENVYTRELNNGEEVLTDQSIYGLSLKNVSIDFVKRTASFDLIKNVILGFNRPLLVTGARVSIGSDHEMFQDVLNLVNRKSSLINVICLSDSLEIIDLKTN